jgi:hypothetical protein
MLNRSFAWLAARLRFSKRYGGAAIAVLAVELVIALFVRDAFIRPYVGDTLAVVLLYCTVLAALELPRAHVALGVLGVALLVELAQAFSLVERLGLADVAFARVVLGTYCDARDVLAYTAALPLLALAERAATSRCRCTS